MAITQIQVPQTSVYYDIDTNFSDLDMRLNNVENTIGVNNIDANLFNADMNGAVQIKLTPGNGIKIDENNVISVDMSLIPDDYNELQSDNRELEAENVALRFIIDELKEELGLKTEKSESKEVVTHRPDIWQDFMLDAESYANDLIEIEGQLYEISDNITDFIREYAWDTYSQIHGNLKELVDNGLLERRET